MGKQIDGEDDDDVVKGRDRISQLPQHIFQHILSFLSQQDAVKTSVLSKPCRYLWSTRPIVEFCERDFTKPCRFLWSTTTCPNVEFCGMDFTSKIEKFMDFVDKTLQVYHDQNLSIERFCVDVDVGGWSFFSLLKKWIPKAVCDLSVKTFELKICTHRSALFEMPPEFFRAQSLQNLYLQQCRWTIYGSVGDRKPLFKHLRTLHLKFVTFEDGEFEKTMSSCPLIERVVLDNCVGLRTINFVNNHNFNLKHFEFTSYYVWRRAEDVNIQIYTPSITTIIIHWCHNWYYRHIHYSKLKSLHLNCVRISKESFDSFSSNFPCLEELKLKHCFGFEEFKLSSPSIKHLRIDYVEKLTKAAIDAPKIVLFGYTSDVGAASFSFATTSKKWKSYATMFSTVDLDFDASSWFLKISELLTGLSQSEITLDLLPWYMRNEDADSDIRALLVPNINYMSGFYNKPVAVERLRLDLVGLYSASSFPHFINALFRVCRPRKMGSHYWYAEEKRENQREHNQVIKSLCKILRMGKDECRDDQEMSCWQQDLEEVILEVLDENEEGEEDGVWHPVLATNWLEYCDALTPKNLENDPHELRFILKWC